VGTPRVNAARYDDPRRKASHRHYETVIMNRTPVLISQVANLRDAWIEAEASLPVGWRVSGLERDPDTESWRGWASPGKFAGDPKAVPIDGHGRSAEQALIVLARNARARGGGPMSG